MMFMAKNSELKTSLVKAINEALPEAILVVNDQGIIVSHNRHFVEIWKIPDDHLSGFESGTAIGIKNTQILAKIVESVKDPESFLARVRELYENPHLNDHCEIALSDGRTLERHSTTLRSNDGQYLGRVWFFRDITERKQAEENLLLTRFVSDHGPDSIFWIDEQARIVYVNEAACRERGYTKSELLAMSIPEIDANCPVDVWIAHWQELKQKGSLTFEVRHRRKDGSIFPVEISANFVDFGGKEFNIAFSRDITMRKQAEDEIQLLAFYDPLTRLPNRRLLMDRLQHAVASSMRSCRNGALLFIDLDHFKTLNDTLGHDTGDLLLQDVAQRLQACVRQGDTVARLGGDEFVVILENLSENDLEAATQTENIGEKILAALNEPYQLNQHESRSSPSIGATLFGGRQQAIDELLKQADIAMYQAKKSGRNTLRFFDPKMQEAINAHAALEGELRKALEKRQFHLHYQIQVDSLRRPVGAEALIRWLHPERGLVSPAQFIPLAEETGVILPMGLWVLETACAQIKSWESIESTRNLVLSVNVSAKQFHQADFVSQVQAAVRNHAINPDLLKLELTESMLLENIEDTIGIMNALKGIGVGFSLDDFGTGYSSLQYLKRLPLSQLKIDQSFIRDLAVDSSDRAIVSTIIAMAQSLGLDVIAEGVETAEQWRFLQESGCNHYQGFLFGKPAPIEQLESILGCEASPPHF